MSDEISAPTLPLPETAYETPNGDCRIAFRQTGHVLQVLAPPFGADVSAHLSKLSEGGSCAVRATGPGAWYVVGDALLTPQDVAHWETQLGAQITLIDQTHGRVRLELSGPGAARRLATGTAVDLSLHRFAEGAACETLFGHISIHLTRTDPDRFEVLVGRSLALSLWDELAR